VGTLDKDSISKGGQTPDHSKTHSRRHYPSFGPIGREHLLGVRRGLQDPGGENQTTMGRMRESNLPVAGTRKRPLEGKFKYGPLRNKTEDAALQRRFKGLCFSSPGERRGMISPKRMWRNQHLGKHQGTTLRAGRPLPRAEGKRGKIRFGKTRECCYTLRDIKWKKGGIEEGKRGSRRQLWSGQKEMRQHKAQRSSKKKVFHWKDETKFAHTMPHKA